MYNEYYTVCAPITTINDPYDTTTMIKLLLVGETCRRCRNVTVPSLVL
jgi:hypothetical protein